MRAVTANLVAEYTLVPGKARTLRGKSITRATLHRNHRLLVASDAVDVDDVPVDLVLLEDLQGFPGRDAQTEDVGVEGPPPGFGGAVGEVAVREHARVVDEDVDGAQVLLDPPETVEDVLFFGDVDSEGAELGRVL